MNSEDDSKKPQDHGVSKWTFVLVAVIGALLIALGYYSFGRKSPGLPIGGVVETEKEIAAYNRAAETYAAEMAAMTTTNGHSPSPASKELLSTTSDYNFDNKEIRFNIGERMKIIQLEPGKTSPKIIIPNGPSWDLKEIDSTEVWLKSGVKYMDAPKDNHRIQEREFRLTGRNPVTILIH